MDYSAYLHQITDLKHAFLYEKAAEKWKEFEDIAENKDIVEKGMISLYADYTDEDCDCCYYLTCCGCLACCFGEDECNCCDGDEVVGICCCGVVICCSMCLEN